MRKQFSLFSKLPLLLLSISLVGACSQEDSDNLSKNDNLYSGTDLSSYFELTANAKTKTATINLTKTGSWKLFSANNSDQLSFNSPILQGSTIGKIELSDAFQIYGLEWSDGSRYTMGLRQLPIEGQLNFRDLGGYSTKDGKHLKWGLIFRSGKCNALTKGDLDYLSSIPLKTIIDFRSDGERTNEPDIVPSSVKNTKNLPIDPGNLSNINILNAIDKGLADSCRQYMIDLNESLIIDFQDSYKQYFATLIDKEQLPLMFHCTAGKDRAGLGAALFLSALGVDRETVIKDYLLTNELTHATLENMQAVYGKTDKALAMYYVMSVQQEYIEKAFTTIEKNYGSVDSYITNQLGVDVSKLKQLYLY